MKPENAERAALVANAITPWIMRGEPKAGRETVVDLVVDVMHFCDMVGVDFGYVLDTARMHHETESQEPA